MTRCKEFYEKLERDGNFCGMRADKFKEAMKYWKEYRVGEERNDPNGVKSCDTWVKEQREQAKKTTPTEPEEAKPLPDEEPLEHKAGLYLDGIMPYIIAARRGGVKYEYMKKLINAKINALIEQENTPGNEEIRVLAQKMAKVGGEEI